MISASVLVIGVSTAGIVFGGMLASAELGYRAGRRMVREVSEDSSQVGTIQGAILGLLALLLGFSFAAAAARFIERQDVIVQEANAIGTAYLRADLMDEPDRSEYRKLLRDYAVSRTQLFDAVEADEGVAARTVSESLHPQLWRTAVAGVRKLPRVDPTILPPLNEVIDLHTTRTTLMRRHLPVPVVVVLCVIAFVAIAAVGYGNGLRGRRHFIMTNTLAILIATVLWISIDLDFPRSGILQIDQRPMTELMKSISATP